MIRLMVTFERLHAVLKYDPETGGWEWLPRAGNARYGGPAGAVTTGGYLRIEIDGSTYAAHRLAWFYMTGEWPPSQIDHEDTDRANNRWSNLRLATPKQNAANQRCRANNSLGVKGVNYVARAGKFRATIYVDKRNVHLGYFRTAEAASAAYEKKAQEIFGEFARAA
jgi:hypothetical protein